MKYYLKRKLPRSRNEPLVAVGRAHYGENLREETVGLGNMSGRVR